MLYTVKAVKEFRGHDGHGYECKLYKANKPVAVVVDDGWGGGLQFHWNDADAEQVDVAVFNLQSQERVIYKGTPEESAFAEFCEKLPKWKCNDKMIHTCMDVFTGQAVEDFLQARDFRKIIKKVAILTDGKCITFNCGIDHPQVRDLISKDYPDAVILNDLSFDEALKQFLAAA